MTEPPVPHVGAVPVLFPEIVWQEEVGRFRPRSLRRSQAERARREIETGVVGLKWRRCQPHGPERTELPGCRKLYVPLDASGPSDAPWGFIFRLTQMPDLSLAWMMIAFGDRHPERRTRSVYDRAHRRLHGRYPN